MIPSTRAALAAAVLLLFAPSGLRAQAPDIFGEEGQLVDRVAAVVGDSVILMSQLQEEILRLQAQGRDLPDDPEGVERLRRDLLESLVERQILVQAALRDTLISLDEERVEELLQREIQGRIQSFGSQSALQRALEAQGLTLSQFRETIRAQIRQDLLQQQFLAIHARRTGSITIDEEEIREAFERRRAELGERPAELRLSQVVVRPEAADSARAESRAEAERVLDLVREGDEDFATLARRFSQDPGTRQEGGDLGWVRRGSGFVQEFEDVAFRLREGQVSDVVETSFGFHVIRVDRVRGAERKIRHILVRPDLTEADVERARERAMEARDALAAGEDLEEVRARYASDPEPDTATVPLPRLGEALPEALADSLVDARAGDAVGPVESGTGASTAFRIVLVVDRREPGEYTLEDLRERIRESLREQRIIESILEDLRERTYVDIRV